MEKGQLEYLINRIEEQQSKLTVMKGHFGIAIRAHNDFANKFLHPSGLSYKFVNGKIGLATCTDATILVPEDHFPQFLRLFGEYAVEHHLRPEIDIKEEEYNFFTEEEKPVTYLDIYDRNEC